MDVDIDRYGYTVDSKKLEHGCGMSSASSASFFGLGCRTAMFQLSGLYCRIREETRSPLRPMEPSVKDHRSREASHLHTTHLNRYLYVYIYIHI